MAVRSRQSGPGRCDVVCVQSSALGRGNGMGGREDGGDVEGEEGKGECGEA